jgi:hypothetical protein
MKAESNVVRQAKARARVLAAINAGATTRAELVKKLAGTQKYVDQLLHRMVHAKVLNRADGEYSIVQATGKAKSTGKGGVQGKKQVELRTAVLEALNGRQMTRGELMEIPAVAKLVRHPHHLSVLLAAMREENLLVRALHGYTVSGGSDPAHPIVNGQSVRLDYVLYIGSTKVQMTDAEAGQIVRLLSARVKV